MKLKQALTVFLTLSAEQKFQMLKYLWGQVSAWKKVIVYLGLAYLIRKYIYKRLFPFDSAVKSGSVVVITGAGSGIGRSLSLKLSKLGCKIALWDINEALVSKTCEDIKKNGGVARYYIADVSDREKVYSLSIKVIEEFGRVDILINNAGVVSGKTILEIPDKLAQKTMDINCTAHIWMVKAFLPEMIKRKKGLIVSIASAAGLAGTAGLTDYSASKFGAFGFNEALRLDLKHKGFKDITTLCVCPYYINTGMFDGIKTHPLLPMLNLDYVANRIIRSMREGDELLCMPRIVYFVPLFRFLLPVWLMDKVSDLLGISSSMSTFQGNNVSFNRTSQ